MTTLIKSIRYTIQAGNLLTEGAPTADAVDRLAQATADAIIAAFPGAEVTCPVERTSGVRPAGYTRVVMSDPEADDYDIRERLSQIADAAWEAWCAGLAEADVVRWGS